MFIKKEFWLHVYFRVQYELLLWYSMKMWLHGFSTVYHITCKFKADFKTHDVNRSALMMYWPFIFSVTSSLFWNYKHKLQVHVTGYDDSQSRPLHMHLQRGRSLVLLWWADWWRNGDSISIASKRGNNRVSCVPAGRCYIMTAIMNAMNGVRYDMFLMGHVPEFNKILFTNASYTYCSMTNFLVLFFVSYLRASPCEYKSSGKLRCNSRFDSAPYLVKYCYQLSSR